MSSTQTGKLAVVTGASSGIGYELAKLCAGDGYSLILAANESLGEAKAKLEGMGVAVETVETDLSTAHGVNELWDKVAGRPVDVLCANAGRGLGDAFLDQDWDRIKEVIDLNVTGTTSLVHKVARQMRERNEGRVLITASIASFLPGAYQAVYNATKAYAESFAYAIRNELKETNVTVTTLMPGVTDTDFFDRADLEGSQAAEQASTDPAKVAKDGYEAMQKGEPGIVSGFMNKVQTAFAGVLPETMLAEMHRHLAKKD